MVKTSGNASKKSFNQNIFVIEDLSKIKQVIRQIRLGFSSQEKTADEYNVTRYQVRRWYEYFTFVALNAYHTLFNN